jgi:hypothetical protein
MAQLIRSLNWGHAKKTMHIFAHLMLFSWIVVLVMHTKEMDNNALVTQYFGVALYTLSLLKLNQNIIND